MASRLSRAWMLRDASPLFALEPLALSLTGERSPDVVTCHGQAGSGDELGVERLEFVGVR